MDKVLALTEKLQDAVKSLESEGLGDPQLLTMLDQFHSVAKKQSTSCDDRLNPPPITKGYQGV